MGEKDGEGDRLISDPTPGGVTIVAVLAAYSSTSPSSPIISSYGDIPPLGRFFLPSYPGHVLLLSFGISSGWSR